MLIQALINEQFEWDGRLRSFTFQSQDSVGPMWVSFPGAFEENSEPFNFLDDNYTRLYEARRASCREVRLTPKRFYSKNDNFFFVTTWNEIPTRRHQLTYYALYLPEFAVPTEIRIHDTRNPEIEFGKTVYRDDVKCRYIIFLECRSKVGVFNFKLHATFHNDPVNFGRTEYRDLKTIDFYEGAMNDYRSHVLGNNDSQRINDFFKQPSLMIMDRKAIRKDIIDLIDQNLYNNVDIAPIIEKHTIGKEIEEQANTRVAIVGILKELRDAGDITFPDSTLQITARQGGEFFSSSGLVRSTYKYEEKKDQKQSQYTSLHIGGSVTGNINTGNVNGSLSQTNSGSITIDSAKEAELVSYGVDKVQIEELKSIVAESKEKSTLLTKTMKWLGGVTSSLVVKGLSEHIPSVMNFIHNLTS